MTRTIDEAVRHGGDRIGVSVNVGDVSKMVEVQVIFEIHYNRTWAGGIEVMNLYIDDPSAGHPNEPHFALSTYRATSHYTVIRTPPPNIMY